MKGKRFSGKQIIAVLKEVNAGVKVLDVRRKHGVSEQGTSYTSLAHAVMRYALRGGSVAR